MLTLADNFQIGAALTLAMPLGLLLILAVWFMFVFRRVPKDTPESSTALPPAEMVAAAGDAIHEISPIDDAPPADGLMEAARMPIADALPATGAGGLLAPAARATIGDYVTLTKPRIMSLLVLTAVCGMVAGAGGAPSLGGLLALTVGGALACGGASALNHVLDRDIDRLMGPRTASRPVAAGRISPQRAVIFGLGLSLLSFALLAAVTNLLAASLAVSGGAYYVLVYTLWLKRRTAQNIVIGGAAGAIPPLAGWAAAHGSLGLGALYLFVIVLLWTPPHFWALALLLAPHYEAARVPMLPVVRGTSATARQVLGYTLLLTVVTVVPFVTGTFGAVYLVAAVGLGGGFCGLAVWMWRAPQARRAALLFHYSLLYLALLFVAVALDAAVR